MSEHPTPRETERFSNAPLVPANDRPMGWSDGACPSCGGEEWEIERHWGRPQLTIYTCPCGAWDQREPWERLSAEPPASGVDTPA